MSQMYGKKSDYLQNKIISYKSITIVVIGLFFIIIFYILEHFFELASYKGLLVIVLIIIPLVLLLNFIGNKSLLKSFNYSQGKRGEENIWYVLKKLPNEYCVFQDIKMSRGNVDFVVLGPTGLFVVEVKSHHGEVEFDGQELTNNGKRFEKDFLKQAKGEALQISNFLKNNLQQDVFIQWQQPDFQFQHIDDIHIFACVLDVDPDVVNTCLQQLSSHDQARAGRLQDASKRMHFIMAHFGLQQVLTHYVDEIK